MPPKQPLPQTHPDSTLADLLSENPHLAPTALRADNFDSAIIGTAARGFGEDHVLVYSVPRIIAILQHDGLSEEEAWEHFSFNIEGAYLGPKTPLYVYALYPGLDD